MLSRLLIALVLLLPFSSRAQKSETDVPLSPLTVTCTASRWVPGDDSVKKVNVDKSVTFTEMAPNEGGDLLIAKIEEFEFRVFATTALLDKKRKELSEYTALIRDTKNNISARARSDDTIVPPMRTGRDYVKVANAEMDVLPKVGKTVRASLFCFHRPSKEEALKLRR